MRRALRCGLALWLVVASALVGRSTAIAQDTATVVAYAVDEDGAAVPEACYSPWAQRFGVSPVRACDGDDGSEDGVTTVANAPAGDGFLVMDGAPSGYRVGARQPYSLQTGQSIELSFAVRKGGQTLTISVRDKKSGKRIGGVCGQVFRHRDLGQTRDYIAQSCAGNGGAVTIDGLEPGTYRTFLRLPENRTFAKAVPAITIRDGQDAKMTVESVPSGIGSATVVDEAGQPIAGLCVAFFDASTKPPVQVSAGLCGSSPFAWPLAVGTYLVRATSLPQGYQQSGDTPTFEVKRGEQTDVSITLQTGGQGVLVTELGEADQVLQNGCVVVEKTDVPGEDAGFACDFNDGPADGVVTLWGLEPGSYLVRDAAPPVRYGRAPAVTVDIGEGETAAVTLRHQLAMAASVILTDDGGVPLLDGCFAAVVFDGDSAPIVDRFSCDDQDGAADGRTTLNGLPSGTDVTILPMVVPDGYELPRGETVSGDPGVAVEVNATAGRGGGNVMITRLDAAGEITTDSCIFVYAQSAGERGRPVAYACDISDEAGDDGLMHIDGLRPGRYLLAEVRIAVEGERLPTDRPFTIKDGETTEITMQNSPA